MSLAVLIFFALGTPHMLSWLSGSMKRVAAARVVWNKTGSDRQKRSEWKRGQLRTTFRYPETYLLFFANVENTIWSVVRPYSGIWSTNPLASLLLTLCERERHLSKPCPLSASYSLAIAHSQGSI